MSFVRGVEGLGTVLMGVCGDAPDRGEFVVVAALVWARRRRDIVVDGELRTATPAKPKLRVFRVVTLKSRVESRHCYRPDKVLVTLNSTSPVTVVNNTSLKRILQIGDQCIAQRNSAVHSTVGWLSSFERHSQSRPRGDIQFSVVFSMKETYEAIPRLSYERLY